MVSRKSSGEATVVQQQKAVPVASLPKPMARNVADVDMTITCQENALHSERHVKSVRSQITLPLRANPVGKYTQLTAKVKHK